MRGHGNTQQAVRVDLQRSFSDQSSPWLVGGGQGCKARGLNGADIQSGTGNKRVLARMTPAWPAADLCNDLCPQSRGSLAKQDESILHAHRKCIAASNLRE